MDDVVENQQSILAYVKDWNVIGASALTWNVLDGTKRQEIVQDLLKKMVESDCKKNFPKLRRYASQRKFQGMGLTIELTKWKLRSRKPVMRAAAPYLALYYSKEDGQFDKKYFAANYARANSY